jgi:hypothetical protein
MIPLCGALYHEDTKATKVGKPWVFVSLVSFV